MKRRLAAVSLAAALLAILPAAAHAAPQWRGVQISPLNSAGANGLRGDFDHAKTLKANVVRMEVEWSRLEPDEQGEYDERELEHLDTAMLNASKRGIKVIVLLQSSPKWASSNPSSKDFALYPPKNASDYGAIAGFIAKRYSSKLAAIEVWNEPDHASEFYFKGGDKPGRYAALLKAAYPRIKSANKSVAVLAGSLVGANGKFLQALYGKGIKGSYDGIAVHFYDVVFSSIRSIKDVQKRNGDSKPLWLTEFGWTSCYPKRNSQGGHDCVTAAQQAANLNDVFAALKKRSDIKAAVVYTMYDTKQYDFGVLTSKNKRKLAFKTLIADFQNRPARARKLTMKITRSGNNATISGVIPAGDSGYFQVYKPGASTPALRATIFANRDRKYSKSIPGLGRGAWFTQIEQFFTGQKVVVQLK